ncbi:peptidoglycan DD-metalloendopeptidase family protein [Citricoccus sp. NPDC055426]|uniref:peptidoglycan DD-metalloendopeptidase family protein n=1 Tax=Citricoccus sp. NPDC055426 TaxID=3155536 RepID=UPI0034386735
MTVENRSRLTSGYGYQAWRKYTHTGVDFGGVVPGQSSPVYAAADGVVEIAADGTIPLRTGPQIKLRHPDGSATTYGHTRYCKVRRGQVVRRGDRLADTWHTGLKASAGIHLHFEWWKDSDNPYSHHDPIARLADYGWTIREGRLYDDWDGRSTATPIYQHASTTPKEDTLSAAEVNEIKAHVTDEVDRLYDRLITYGGLSWAKVGHNGENLRSLLWDAAVGSQAAFANTNAIKAANSEVIKAVAEVSASTGLTPGQVADLVDRVAAAAEKGASEAVEAGFTVDITATTTANKKEG